MRYAPWPRPGVASYRAKTIEYSNDAILSFLLHLCFLLLSVISLWPDKWFTITIARLPGSVWLNKYLPQGSTRHHSTKEKRRASRPSVRLKSYLRLNRYLLELLTRYIIISSSRYQLNSRTSYNWSRLVCGIYVCVQRTKYYHRGRLKIGSERGVYVLSFVSIAWRGAVSN